MTRQRHRPRRKVPGTELVRYGTAREVVALRVRCGECSRPVGSLSYYTDDPVVLVHGTNGKVVPAGDARRMELPTSHPDHLSAVDHISVRAGRLPIGWYFECRRCGFVGFLPGASRPGSYGAAEALAAHRAEMKIQTLKTGDPDTIAADRRHPSGQERPAWKGSSGKWATIGSASTRRRPR